MMNLTKAMYWAPRILSVIYAPILNSFIPYKIHLLPSFSTRLLSLLIISAILIISWKWVMGGLVWIGISMFFVGFIKNITPLVWLLIITPTFLIGVLFLISDSYLLILRKWLPKG